MSPREPPPPPSEARPPAAPAPRVSAIGFVLRLLRPHRGWVALLFLGLLVDVGFGAAVPIGLQALIDRALLPRDLAALRAVLTALAVATLVAGAVAVGRDALYAKIGSAVPNDLRQQLFEQLQRLPMQYYARTQTGDILSRFSADLAAIEGMVTVAVPLVVLSVLGIGVYLALLFALEARLAAVVLIGMPLCLLGPRVFGGKAALSGDSLRAQEADLVTAVQENVFAQPIVKVFGLRRAVIADFARRTAALRETSRRFNLMSYLAERMPLLAVLAIQVGVFGAGSYLVYSRGLTVGALVAFHALFVSLSAAVALLSQQIPILLTATGGVTRLAQLLDEPARIEDPPAAPALPRPDKDIVLRDVSFGYTEGRANLAGVNLTIPHGASVAFVGPSGSGKSTILNLLTRFYDPRAGAVLVDGVDLRSVTQDSWRAHLAVVFQESFLFDTTVRENIRVGRPGATDEEVEAAARAAEIHDDVGRMQQGYDTRVGARGGLLSGGQRQRVAIARALLRDPAILLLDEATSALDPGSEAAINRTLARLASGRTVVSVTHRLSSVREMDRIFVLAQGRLVEQGSHAELLTRGGLYRSLAARQGGMTVSPDGARARVEVARLRDFPPFADLGDELLAELADKLVTTHLPPGATIVREGERGEWFYLVVRGSVAAWKRGRHGERRNLATYRDGEYFGEIALLRDVPRKATVEATAETTLLGLDRATFDGLLARAPALRAALHRDFAATTI